MVGQMEKWRRIDEEAGACLVGDGNMKETRWATRCKNRHIRVAVLKGRVIRKGKRVNNWKC